MACNEWVTPEIMRPLDESERVATLDVVRGFALLGILAVYFRSFAMPLAAYIKPTGILDHSGLHRLAPLFTHVVFDFRMMNLLLMLLAIWISLLSAGPPSLRHFSFGPSEWFRRSVTHQRLHPMRPELILVFSSSVPPDGEYDVCNHTKDRAATASGNLVNDRSGASCEVGISVVIPTWNRKALLARMLHSLETQDIGASRFEIVVVDDASTDDTIEWLSTYESGLRLRVVRHHENRGPASARNTGVSHARGELIVFLDSDMICTRSLVSSHWQAHRAHKSRTLAALGRMVFHEEVRKIAPALTTWFDTRNPAQRTDGYIPPTRFGTGNVSIHKELIELVGRFDENFKRCFEDIDLGLRLEKVAGYKLIYCPAAVSYHYHTRTLKQFAGRMTLAGESDFHCLVTKHGMVLDSRCGAFAKFVGKLGQRATLREKLGLPVLARFAYYMANCLPFRVARSRCVSHLIGVSLCRGFRKRCEGRVQGG